MLGLIRAGEFRSGNNREIGDSFTGMRIGYPGFAYPATSTESTDLYNLAGVDQDTIMVGIGASDGVLYFGGGAGFLNSTGLQLTIRGSSSETPLLQYVESTGDSETKAFLTAFEIVDDSNSISMEMWAGNPSTGNDPQTRKSQVALYARSYDDTSPNSVGGLHTFVMRAGSTDGDSDGFEISNWNYLFSDSDVVGLSTLTFMQTIIFGEAASDGSEIIFNAGQDPMDIKFHGDAVTDLLVVSGIDDAVYFGATDTANLDLGYLNEKALTIASTATAGIEDPDNEAIKLWADTDGEARLTDSAGEDWYLTKSTSTGVGTEIACRIYSDTNVSLSTSVWTDLTFNQERWDYGDMHDVVTDNERITFPSTGLYTIGGTVIVDSGCTNFFLAVSHAATDGSTVNIVQMEAVSGDNFEPRGVIQTDWEINNTDDFVIMRVFNAGAGAATAQSTDFSGIEFWARRIR